MPDVLYVDPEFFASAVQLDNSWAEVAERVIRNASRLIDRITGVDDGFYAETAATRRYDGTSRDVLALDQPLLEVTALKTDGNGDGTYETTWSAADYLLYPLNGTSYREIQVSPQGTKSFPIGPAAIQLEGNWGVAIDVPGPIEQACILQANRWLNRHKTPEGVAGSADVGFTTMQKMDPDVRAILVEAGYIRRKVFF